MEFITLEQIVYPWPYTLKVLHMRKTECGKWRKAEDLPLVDSVNCLARRLLAWIDLRGQLDIARLLKRLGMIRNQTML